MSMSKDVTIPVAGKPQLCDARNVNEDWTGRASAKERRKLQNRLHQRAWRRRKAQEASTHRPQDVYPVTRTQLVTDAFAHASAALIDTSHVPISPHPSSFDASSRALMKNGAYVTPPILSSLHHTLNKPSLSWPTCVEHHKSMLLTTMIHYVGEEGEDVAVHRRAPFHPSPFPLTPDHYLITLIQYNTLRGVLTNFLLVQVGLDHICQKPGHIPLLHTPPKVPPPTFRCTPIQQSIKHEGWIDSVPCPTLRDNLILATVAGTLDEDDLCDDICGGLHDGFDEVESRGLLVWGNPWETASWEVSAGFLRKWGGLLKGCREMLRATNKWRESRGEEPLVLEI